MVLWADRREVKSLGQLRLQDKKDKGDKVTRTMEEEWICLWEMGLRGVEGEETKVKMY